MKQLLLAGLMVLSNCALAWAQHPAEPVPSAFEPASSGGIETVDRALAKLSTHRRMMMIGAHPDDEGNSLMALVARGMGGESAYLSLSRGEGGQNLVGPELGVGLGVIRTGELLAARSVDGGRQFFTRAYDFGYTRSLDEALERWPREILLEDAVRAVRRFRPQVIVSVFPSDARAGHGQHQAAGVIGAEMYEASGTPDRFKELTRQGLGPWQPLALYRRTWWDRDATTLQQPVGILEPLSGRSVLQLAAGSRSMHRSQDMGMLQPIGPRDSGLGWVAGGAGVDGDDLFAGIDTRLAAIASTLAPGDLRDRVQSRLGRVETLAREARNEISPQRLDLAVRPLADILGELRAVQRELRDAGGPFDSPDEEITAVSALVEEKIEVAETGLAAAAGIVIDAVAQRDRVAIGGKVEVTTSVWNAGVRDLTASDVRLVSLAGWTAEGVESADSERSGAEISAGSMSQWTFEAAPPGDGPPTLPYFLRQPREGDLYGWQGLEVSDMGEPYQPPPLVARFELDLAGTTLTLEKEVVYRFADQAIGEIRRPLRSVPELEVEVSPSLVVWARSGSRVPELEIVIRSNVDRAMRGTVELEVPSGWPSPRALEFSIGEARGLQVVRTMLELPSGLERDRFDVGVSVRDEDGATYSLAFPLLDYPHIRPTTLKVAARVTVQTLDLNLPQVGRVGYVRGAADRVPEALRDVGVDVEILNRHDLTLGDLGGYGTIVVGPRAYETDEALVQANSRLLEWVEGGGTLIVQYQQYQFSRGGYAPFPLEIARPHDRVTDEASPVRVLESEHAVFRFPNRISDDDWNDWVQERGLYFAHTWDPAFEPLLALKDPDREEQSGALLVAELGEGTYVYTGLSFFRELPAGVPGAYRLFSNLLALGEKR